MLSNDFIYRFSLRPWLYIFDDRVFSGRVKIKRLVTSRRQIGDPSFALNWKAREIDSLGPIIWLQIYSFEIHDFGSITPIHQDWNRRSINSENN